VTGQAERDQAALRFSEFAGRCRWRRYDREEMATLRVTYLDRRSDSGALEEVGHEEFEDHTSPEAADRALEAAQKWIESDLRNRSYRIDRLLPPE